VEGDQTCDESSTPSPPLSPRGNREKAEALVDSLDTQFQPVIDLWVPAIIEIVDVALRSYFLIPASEPQLTTRDEFHEAIRGLKLSKAPGPNGIPKRTLKHLPKRAFSLLAHIFIAVFHTHHFPRASKHATLIYILKPGKDPALPSS